MQYLVKGLPALFALLFLLMGASILLDPNGGAAQFSVQPIGTDGLNTIRGDLGGLFLGCGVLLVLGVLRSEAIWLNAVAIFMLVIAAGRLLGFIVDGSPSSATLTAFGFELAYAVILLFCGKRIGAASTP